MVLEPLVVVLETVLVGTTLVMEETLVVEVALVAAVLVVDMVAVGMPIIDLIMMEAILEVAEATVILRRRLKGSPLFRPEGRDGP